MKAIFAIAAFEFKRQFNTPLAWCLLAVIQFVLAWVFLLGLNDYLTQYMQTMAGSPNAPGMTYMVGATVFAWAGMVMLGIMPLLTMRTFAEERMNHSLSLLTSAPISFTQLVLGKYLGLLALVLLMVLMVMLMPASLLLGTEIDWGVVFSGALGLFLLLASFAAAGMYLSCLTRQPIIAAISTFGFLVLLVILYLSGNSAGAASDLLVYLSHFGHFTRFLEGAFSSTDLVYYLLFITVFLVLTIRRFDNQRIQG